MFGDVFKSPDKASCFPKERYIDQSHLWRRMYKFAQYLSSCLRNENITEHQHGNLSKILKCSISLSSHSYYSHVRVVLLNSFHLQFEKVLTVLCAPSCLAWPMSMMFCVCVKESCSVSLHKKSRLGRLDDALHCHFIIMLLDDESLIHSFLST